MTLTLAAWESLVDGKTIGSGECVALVDSYCTQVVGSPVIPTTGDNYAITQYENFPAGGLDKWYERIPGALGPFAPGDVLFWNRGSAVAPVSHTAVNLADLGALVSIESQNTNGHRYAEKTTLPKAGLAGALRPLNPAAVNGTGGSVSLAGDVLGTAAALPALAAAWGKVITWLRDPANWRRIGIALLGIILILLALVKILKNTPAADLLKAKTS